MGLRVVMPLTAANSATFVWLALLLNYCVHAALAALVAGWLARRHTTAAQSNALWKLALFSPLATAALSSVWPSGAKELLPTLSSWSLVRPSWSAVGTLADRAGARDLPLLAANVNTVSQVLGALSVAALCVGVLRFAAAVLALRRALLGRAAVGDSQVLARFERLRKRAALPQVQLSESQHVPGPLIVGLREICLPSAILTSCSEPELDAILAHELAHIERRDGLWFPLVGLVEAVLWFQPYNRHVAARYRQSAELACDDRAVQLTGAPVALARALTRIAEVTLSARLSVLTAGMANSSYQPRLERVRRLLADPSTAPKQSAWAALTCLCLLGLASPSLHLERKRGPDLDTYEATMHTLSLEAEQLEAELAHTPEHAAARTQELEQALRHVRETQAWTEHQQAAWDYESH